MMDYLGYRSLFDRFSCRNKYFNLEYSGRMYEIFDELESALNKEIKDSLEERILFPPRILKGLLEYKIKFQEDKKNLGPEKEFPIVQMILETCDLCRSVYDSSEGASNLLYSLKEKIIELDIFEKYIKQEKDGTSEQAIQAEYTINSLEKLYEKTNSGILLLSLANGSIPAGMDLFLRYTSSNEDCSMFYPVRFSKYKHKDEIPRVSEYELECLKYYSNNKTIVIFDEDRASGMTLADAETFFESKLKKEIFTIANLDLKNKIAF